MSTQCTTKKRDSCKFKLPGWLLGFNPNLMPDFLYGEITYQPHLWKIIRTKSSHKNRSKNESMKAADGARMK
jgi:hypothetical protein